MNENSNRHRVDQDSSRGAGSTGGQNRLDELERRLKLDPDNMKLLLEASRYYHRLAMQGNSEAFAKAERSISRILKRDKRNVEALSIAGSLLTIKARRSSSLPKRIWYSIIAARKLDRAVRLDPTNVSARTIRAFTALVLPSFLKRLRTAADDFEYLIEVKSNDPRSLPDEMMPKVYFNLGLAYAKIGDKDRATDVLSQVMELFPGTREHNRAKSLLARIKELSLKRKSFIG